MASEGYCEAQFVGRAPVSGPITTHYLDSFVSTLIQNATPAKDSPPASLDDARCRLKCGSDGLVVWNSIRKDEGFESDGESQTSLDGEKKPEVAKNDVKPSDDTSSANSSGSDSDLEVPVTRPKQQHLQIYDFATVLFCHIPESSPSMIAWVLKAATSMECLVFDCLTAAKAVQLYQNFDEQSRAMKLDKLTLKKPGQVATGKLAVSSLSVPKNPDGSMNMKIDGRNICVSVNNVIVEKRRQNGTFSQVQGGTKKVAPKKPGKPWNLLQHTDENGVTHIEIENGGSSHKSLCDIVLPPSDDSHSSIISISAPDPPEPYRSLDSVISLSNWAQEFGDDPGASISSSTQPVSGGASTGSTVASKLPSGGSASVVGKLRQRKPAMLIRAPKSSAGGSENGSTGTRAILFRDSNPPGMKQPFTPSHLKRNFQLGFGESSQELQSPLRDENDSQNNAESFPVAPRPPPRSKLPSSAPSIGHQKAPPPPPPGQTYFIPTKSGAEPRKVLYPKETHVVRGKFVRARVGSGPYEFYPQNFFVPGTFWGTKPLSARESGASTPNFFRYSALEMPELGRSSRDSHSLPPEYRRRSRSKSPARRPPTSITSLSSTPNLLSNWPQKFLRDFSDAMRAKRNKEKGDDFAERMKSFTRTSDVTGAVPSPPTPNGFPTKPAIRKSCRSSKSRSSSRRVTFNSYATVRLLDVL